MMIATYLMLSVRLILQMAQAEYVNTIYEMCPSRRLQGSILDTVQHVSELDCGRHCSKSQGCASANHIKQGESPHCELLDAFRLEDNCAAYPVDAHSTVLKRLYPEVPEPACPVEKGYKVDNSTGICYKYNFTELYWQDARDACAAEGAHLMRFRNYDEWVMIHDEIIGTPELFTYKRYWVDGWAKTEDKVWMDTDGAVLPWLFWEPNEPSYEANKMYMNLLGLDGRNYQLNDERYKKYLPFICQWF